MRVIALGNEALLGRDWMSCVRAVLDGRMLKLTLAWKSDALRGRR